MTSRIAPRILLFIWLMVLGSPLAWAVSLVTMFWLTHPVCQGLSRAVLAFSGGLCGLVALAGAIAAAQVLKRVPERTSEDSGDVPVFLLRLAMWGGLMFALVIALSLVPAGLLTPCPV
jgi:hypothetical protein